MDVLMKNKIRRGFKIEQKHTVSLVDDHPKWYTCYYVDKNTILSTRDRHVQKEQETMKVKPFNLSLTVVERPFY